MGDLYHFRGTKKSDPEPEAEKKPITNSLLFVTETLTLIPNSDPSMASEEGTSKGSVIGDQQSRYPYGTFQGVANYYPPPPHVGFPQPVAPPCVAVDGGGVAVVDVDSRWNPFCRRNEFGGSPQAQYYALGYQTAPGYVLVEGRHHRERSLPCCGLGMGWILFVTGFFLGAIPWYLGTFILLCVRVDYREKPGYVACSIAAILAAIAITLGLTQGGQNWKDWDMPNWQDWQKM